MLRRNIFSFAKVTPVQIRPRVSEAQLAATPRYAPVFKHRLAKRFDRVSDENRFESLRLILQRLSGHVGRRQYALQHDMSSLFLEKFQNLGLDWHEILALPPHVLLHVLEKQVGMTPSQRRLFMTAVHCRVCGVLVEGTTRRPGMVCQNRGLAEHGFRCGKKGHSGRVYFEGKPPRSRAESSANIAALTASVSSSTKFLPGNDNNSEQSASSSSSAAAQEIPKVETEFATEEDAKIKVRVSSKPDFRVVGRLFHESHPRTWSTPTAPSFDVATIGYEFYIHPSDARVLPQIVHGAHEWQFHAEAMRNVIWELLELQAIEKVRPASAFLSQPPSAFSRNRLTLAAKQQQQQNPSSSSSSLLSSPFQPFELHRGDVRSERDVLDALKAYYTTVDPQTGVIIENCMSADDNDDSPSSSSSLSMRDNEAADLKRQRLRNVIPWFVPSDPRPLNANGVPEHFPLAPSIAVQCLYRRPDSQQQLTTTTQESLVAPPFLEFRCFFHNRACFSWPTPEMKTRAVSEILSIGRRVPFALPFTLYFRVDPSAELAKNKGGLRKERDRLLEEKRRFFDLTKFADSVFGGGSGKRQEDVEEDETTTVEVAPESKSDKKKEEESAEEEMERLIRSLNPEGWD